MEDQTSYNIENENVNNQQPSEEIELSHSDKLVGVFTEPSATFEQTAKFPPRVKDWLIPVILIIILSIVSTLLLMSVPNIKYQTQQKQITRMEQNLDEQVAKGAMSREQADQQIERMRTMMEKGSGFFVVIQAVSIIFSTFIIFFIVALIYYAICKLILKGEGTYSSAMVGYGLSYYIGAIALVVITISSLLLQRFVTGTNIAAFLDMDKTTFAGYFISKLDIFVIWSLIIVGIGLAKMFHSNNTKKYIITVFAVWIIWSLIFFGLAQVLSFLKPMLDYM